MPSFFTWLDYSEHDKRKMLDVVRLFRDQETRDELGIGTIRDAFADLFFPGTSTIQTRARYFLFIAWIYRDLERRRVSSSEVAHRARRMEVTLIDALLASEDHESEDSEGIIGRVARGALQRLPSSIYWHGLRTWGIRFFQGSQAQYHQSLDGFYRREKRQRLLDEEEVLDLRPHWHDGLPASPERFPWEASLRLTLEESIYLKERILSRVPRTLLAFLVDKGQPTHRLPFVWQHPQLPDFPERIRQPLAQARHCSEAFHGAALLYNLMLAEQAERSSLIDDYEVQLDTWASAMESHAEAQHTWNREVFWRIVLDVNPNIPIPSRRFVDTWLDLAETAPRDVPHSQAARRLIEDRERTLKRNRARLGNRRLLELWNGAAGTGPLDYRWRVVQKIIADILQPR